MQPFLESNDIIDDTSELRQRAKGDGYLLFRNHFNRLKWDDIYKRDGSRRSISITGNICL